MSTLFRNSIASLSALAIAAAPVPALSQTVGVNSAVRNNVKVRQTTATAAATQAVVKQRVQMGNAITTGGNSGLQVTLLDKSSLTLGPNANLTVNRFVYDPAKGSSSVGASVAKGTFRFMSGRAAKGGRNSVNTPAASIGIRGTMLEGAVGLDAIAIAGLQSGLPSGASVDPNTATVIVLRGPGPQAPGGVTKGLIDVTAGGKTVTLSQPGQALFVPAAGAAPIPFQLNNSAFQQFDSLLRSQPGSFSPSIQQQNAAQNANNQANNSGQSGQGGQSGGAGQGNVVGTAQSTGGAGGGAGAGAAGAAAGAGGISTSLAAVLGVLAAAGVTGVTIAASSEDEPESP
jgi:hypothetical protein